MIGPMRRWRNNRRARRFRDRSEVLYWLALCDPDPVLYAALTATLPIPRLRSRKAVHDLRRDGFIQQEMHRGRRAYRLTTAGRAFAPRRTR